MPRLRRHRRALITAPGPQTPPPRPARRETLRLMTGVPSMDELWRQTVETRLIAAETRNAVDEVHRQNVEIRLGSIEDILKWLVRLILGALVLAILGVAFKSGIDLT